MDRIAFLALGLVLLGSGCGGDAGAPPDITTAATTSTTVGSSPTSTAQPSATTSPTTSTTLPQRDGKLAPSRPGAPPVGLIVSSLDGTFAVAGDEVTRLVEGPVALAVDDLAGGVVFQVAAGERGAAESDGLATRVWWVPAGAVAAQELLVPSPDQSLTLHDVARYAGSPNVYYTRSEGSNPDDDFDRLRRFDLGSGDVTDLGVIGGWESGADPSIAGDLVALDWYSEASQGLSFLSAVDGTEIDVASNPAPDFSECCNGPQRIDLDPEGARFAYLEYLEDEQGYFVTPDLVVVDIAGGVELFRRKLDRPDQGWYPESLDLGSEFVVVNRSRSRSVFDREFLETAWIVELSTGRVWESPVAGRARLLRVVPDITTVLPSP